MAHLRISEWRKLPVSLAELCIDTTLRCGQSFRWKKLDNDEWSCVLKGRIISLKQDTSHLHYRVTWPKANGTTAASRERIKSSIDDDTESLIRHYFNLKPNLTDLYERWSRADVNFRKRAPKFTGVRILKQDPWEALVSFICSSNNNIARISQMVNNLCLHYGPLIGHIADQPFHDFPSPEALTAPGVEAHLRELGFGYRAKYLARTAVIIAEEKVPGWLNKLSNSSDAGADDEDSSDFQEGGRVGYRTAHEELLQLQGVGPKVADCVCLMGLGWGEAVPVDTHVWQIAQKDYKFGKGKHRSLTKTTYDAVGDHFRSLWGREAGWAHSVLFAADLRTFAIRLTIKTEVQIDEVFKTEEDSKILQESAIRKRQILIEDVTRDEMEGNTLKESRKRIRQVR